MKKSKQLYLNREKEKLEKKKQEEILLVILVILLLLVLISFIYWSLTDKANTEDYYVSHYYLFILIIMIFLGTLFRPGGARLMINAFKKLIKSPNSLTRADVTYNILLGINILAFFSFIIIDFSFFKNISLRVPTVVAINLFGILMSYFKTK